jgi:hypothetical protein
MHPTDKILKRAVTDPFYRRHAGAFLFLFFLLFGIQPSAAEAIQLHYFIITQILVYTKVFMVVLFIWMLYAIKTYLYFRGCLANRSYDFIFWLNALPPARKFMHLSRLQFNLLAPIWLYGIAIAVVAWKEQQAAGFIQVFIAITVLFVLTTAACYRLLEKAKATQAITRNPLSFAWPTNLVVFLIRFIFTRQVPALVIVKTVSFFILYILSRTDNNSFEDRMLWLIYITVLIGHSVIIYRCFRFMETELRFYRNLPVKNYSTLLSLLIVYTFLLLPEAWALRGVAMVQHQVTDYIWMVLTGPVLLLLLHCLLYSEDMTMEEFLKLLFGVWIICIFSGLLANRWILPLTGLIFSVIIFLTSYRLYEKEAEVEGVE